MFLLQQILFCSLFCLSTLFGKNTKTIDQEQPLKLVLVDSANHDILKYQSFITLATSVGFKVAHCSLVDLLDAHDKHEQLLAADAIFFIFSIEFLKGMTASPVAQSVLHLVEQVAQQEKKLIGLFFPSLGGATLHLSALAPLWSRLQIQGGKQPVDSFLKAALACINNSVESRAIPYHTMLNAPRLGRAIGILQSDLHKKNNSFAVLPICKDLYPGAKNDFPAVIKSLLPFGVFYPHKKNCLLVSSAGLLSFLGVSENFQLCPTDVAIRYQLYTSLQRFLWEAKALFTAQLKTSLVFNEGICPRLIKAKKITMLPQNLIHSRFLPVQKKMLGAWMELVPFELPKEGIDQELWKKNQRQLIEYSLAAKLDYLWVSFLPNMYYSPVARNGAKKVEFLQAVGRFTLLLKQMAAEKKCKIPHLYVGFEIVNNLVENNIWKKQAQDIYGNNFFDVPPPLDQIFWNQEVIQPFEQFVKDFERPEVGNGLKLAGITLDLEMYGRKTTGEFTSTMLGNEPLSALQSGGTYKKYFYDLEQQAQTLGVTINNACTQALPGLHMAVYAPNVNLDWFYKGFLRGISREQAPLLLLTFNNFYEPYKKNIESYNIFAEHSSVLMLSKIQTPLDFVWINHIAQYQNNIWLNRWSRMVEPYDKTAWFGLEQTPLSFPLKKDFCMALAAVCKIKN